MLKHFLIALLCLTILLLFTDRVFSQISSDELDGSSIRTNDVTALFLTIAPDARSAGMGDVGAATDPDVHSQHWNPAKYAMIKGKGGVSASYSPWLTNLLPNIDLGYLSGYYRINDKSVLSSSFRFFSLGRLTFTNITGIMNTDYLYEMAADLGYSRRFTDHFSAGVTLRYIHSDLLSEYNTADGQNTKPGRSVAADIGLYYQNQFELGTKDAYWALGLNLSNMGNPISYQKNAETETPIPTNLRLGGKFKLELDENNSLSLFTDLNKLLVPTYPVYDYDPYGNLVIIRGMEPSQSLFTRMVQSFYDAPGVYNPNTESYSVLKEEIHEIQYAGGLEYWRKNTFALRSGLFYTHSTKGYRQFITLGAGSRISFDNMELCLDLSYLLPFQGKNSALANTFRISLAISL